MDIKTLQGVARELVSTGKGILAMDESHPTCKRRFDALGIDSNEDSRRSYRGMLVEAPAIGDYISGVILFDETIRQQTVSGVSFARYLESAGVIPGIKVDKGAKALAGHPGEKITEGLDGLRERLAEYRGLGARFAKWRAVITIGDGIPSRACIEGNAHALARYAALCQEAGVVPIVEPEVLMDGAHTIERCLEATRLAQREVFDQLKVQGVDPGGILLKPNMVVPGSECPRRAGAEEVAAMTLKCLRDVVPGAVPGIAFLSGGMSDEVASENLDAINRLARREGGAPWKLTFSYGRALQQQALKTWKGDAANFAAAQRALVKRARLNGAAATGSYSAAMEEQAA